MILNCWRNDETEDYKIRQEDLNTILDTDNVEQELENSMPFSAQITVTGCHVVDLRIL